MKRRKKIFFGVIILLFVSLWGWARFYPVEKFGTDTGGMRPIRNDALAVANAPVIYSTEAYGFPYQMAYRAAIDEQGNTYLAYHIFWKGESNPHSGILPSLNRWLYTGGLKLQKTMFGPGDIEVIEIVLDQSGARKSIRYETAKDYDPKGFSVAHQWVKLEGAQFQDNTVFKVISWNHLFDALLESEVDQEKYLRRDVPLAYFTNDLWESYEMFKPVNTRLKRNRAHFEYERQSVE